MTTNTDRIAFARDLADRWERGISLTNEVATERFSAAWGVADGSLIQRLAETAAKGQVSYQIKALLTHYGESNVDDAVTALLRTSITGTQQNMNTTSEGDRLIKRYTIEAWAEVAQIVGGY